jgi:alkanesulfonate monooxygenase SsuD/methylene tetrahydromethanopterin reductase-like flavin-dependent oxidoreductase (luciferase family)
MFMGGSRFSVKDFAISAERTGFDSVWVGDHVAHYVDGLASLGIIAGCTDEVTIGTNVIVLPFRPAAVVAKAALTVAGASPRRRVVLGVGPGGDVPHEFAMTGADVSTRGRYADEALDVIRRLWSERPCTYHGRWNRFDGVTMLPADGPRPDIWVGGRSVAALRRAVRFGTGYNPYLVSPSQVAERYAQLRVVAAAEGVGLDGFEFAASTFCVPGRDEDEAYERAAAAGGFQHMSEDRFRRMYALGDAATVLARLREYVAVGVRHLVVGCAPGAPDQLVEFSALFRELLPELRRGGA